MLAQARRKLEALGAGDRVSWVEGHIEDAPREAFDGATAFLTLNFIPDDGARLRALREIHQRLVPGAPFLLIDGCTDMRVPEFEEDLRLYAASARRNGAPAEIVEGAVQMLRANLSFVTPEREEQLLREAGFSGARLFYVALWNHGWLAVA